MNKVFNISCICIAIIILISSLMTGCSSKSNKINTEQSSASYVENEDFQYFIDSSSAIAKADNGYYFLNSLKLYFFDTATKEAYIVCNKPNCEHTSSKCTAFFPAFNYYPFQLSYFNNKLYVLGWEEEGSNMRHNYIYEVSLDNFKRKKSTYLFDGTDTSSVSFIIHRGYIYYLKGGGANIKETTACLFRKKIGSKSKKDKAEVIYKCSGIGAELSNIKASGNNLILMNSSFSDTDGNGYKTSYTLIDIHSLKARQLKDDKAYSLFADGDCAYYGNRTGEVYCINLTTNKETSFCNIGVPAYISADSNYVYFDNLQSIYIDKIDEKDRKIFVYDKSGKYVTEITPKNPKDDCYFGGDDMMIFKEIIDGETAESDGAKGYYVLDKSQLKSPDKQFIDME